MWDKIENRLALLELLVQGRLRRRRRQDEAWRWLAELSWTRQSARQDEIVLGPEREADARRLLNQAWPEWSIVQAELEAADLPITEQGWRRLQELDHCRASKGLPMRLNRRTALAQVAAHSKVSLSAPRRQALGDVDLMHDGTVRLRPSAGLQISRPDHQLDATLVAQMLGEVVISERALADGTRFTGSPPQAVVLVENVGAYLDVAVPERWLVAHAPGWDTHTVKLLLGQFTTTPIVLFGDLDPNGVRIARHLRALRPDLVWFVPEFWEEYLEQKALDAVWPADLNLEDAPPLIRRLMSSARWLEQEAIVLDARIPDALCGCLRFQSPA